MSVKQSIFRQFKQPSGILGRLAGHIMANRPSNIQRNRWMLDLLQLKDTDRVLEIGFGPGLAIEGALERITCGQVIGIDHSDVMLKQASRRNAAAISEGRAMLMLADVSELPEASMPFDRIYSANVVQFWDDPIKVFRKLHRMLAPAGSMATLYMPRFKGATSQDSYAYGEKIQRWLEQANFGSIRVEVKEFDHLAAVCVMGCK